MAKDREYVVLNQFKTYRRGKQVTYRRGEVIPENVASAWPNLPGLLGTFIMERHGGPDLPEVPDKSEQEEPGREEPEKAPEEVRMNGKANN